MKVIVSIQQTFGYSLLLLLGVISASLHATEIIDLSKSEFKVYSQNGEDGVIQKIFQSIGTTSKYYVEFGGQDGVQCNTRYLREAGWQGLLMDGSYNIPKINLYQEFITAANINALFAKYHVPEEFDLLSIDIDFNDFYVWKAIEGYHPRVVVIEYNGAHLVDEDKVVIYDAYGKWDRTNYFGASLLALYNLGRFKGYSLVYANANGVNLFFIRDDILSAFETSSGKFKHTNNVKAIYQPAQYGRGPNGGHPQDPKMRPYVSSMDLLYTK